MTVLVNLCICVSGSICSKTESGKCTDIVECKVHGPVDKKETDDKEYIWHLSKCSPVGKRP